MRLTQPFISIVIPAFNEGNVIACAKVQYPEVAMERSLELRGIIVGWFEAAERGDASWRDRHVSRNPDLRIVGTDPDEWLSGISAFGFLKNEAETAGGRVKVTVLEAEAFAEGNTGWGVARPEITLTDGRKVTPRWSAVFLHEDGTWKLIQLHASIAIGNAEAFGNTFEPGPG